MPACLIRHLLASHATSPLVRGEAGSLRADHVLLAEGDGTLAFLGFESFALPRVACEEAVVVLERDASGPDAAEDARWLQSAARRFGARLVRAGAGPAAAVYLRRFAAPGRVVFASDPAAVAAGALGSLVFSGASLEAAAALAGVPVRFEPPAVFEIHLFGERATGAEAEDVMVAIRERLESRAHGAALEFTGPGVSRLSVGERATLARLAPSLLGARMVLFPVDDRSRAWLRARGRETDWRRLETGGAGVDDRVEVSLADAVPRLRPDDDEYALRLRVGPLADDEAIAALARGLAGHVLASGVRCVIEIGGRAQARVLEGGGALAALEASGARVLGSGHEPAGEPEAARATLVHAGADERRGSESRPAGVGRILFAALHGRAPRGDERDSLLSDTGDDAAGVPLDPAETLEPAPEHEREAVALEPGRHHHPIPRPSRLEGAWRGPVLTPIPGRTGSAPLLTWGPRVEAVRGDADALASLVLEGTSPGFEARARAHGGGVVITGREAGGGPGAEATARALAAVGVRVVIAWSFATGGRLGFAQHGLLPLTWRRAEESSGLRPGDVLELSGLPECLLPHAPIELRNLTSGVRHDFDHGLGGADLDVLVAGGLLRWAADAALAPSA